MLPQSIANNIHFMLVRDWAVNGGVFVLIQFHVVAPSSTTWARSGENVAGTSHGFRLFWM